MNNRSRQKWFDEHNKTCTNHITIIAILPHILIFPSPQTNYSQPNQQKQGWNNPFIKSLKRMILFYLGIVFLPCWFSSQIKINDYLNDFNMVLMLQNFWPPLLYYSNVEIKETNCKWNHHKMFNNFHTFANSQIMSHFISLSSKINDYLKHWPIPTK